MINTTVAIITRNVDAPPSSRARYRDQIAETLARFAHAVTRVIVRLTDVNGPRGGIDKRCTITISLAGARPLAVEARGLSVDRAVDAASRRAGRAVARRMARRRRRG